MLSTDPYVGSTRDLIVKNVIDMSVSPGPDPIIAVFAMEGSKVILLVISHGS